MFENCWKISPQKHRFSLGCLIDITPTIKATIIIKKYAPPVFQNIFLRILKRRKNKRQTTKKHKKMEKKRHTIKNRKP